MQAIDLFKALSDATRLKIVMLIQLEGELCVCELMTALCDSQPKISRHLAQLKRMGLLLDRKQKQWVYYRLNPALKGWMLQVIVEACNNSEQFLNTNRATLLSMSDRPNNCCS
ncbi:transcriptional regulator [Psychromonas marina]|uniref:Transcriptional regulator n=1 Tax=Psychromonas marina TaxID=88364 RepID=A0ABQ6DZK2_9GAMM|nr:metalloregulator ArsR/SmtB family transcription factor [Psychromonas marina]GLS90599.1 transcriptional regulator [Psychromonas marina]